jgi:hypothetical protein
MTLEEHYLRHIDRLERRLRAIEEASVRYSWTRLGIVIAGVGVALLLFYTVSDPAGWSAVGFFLLLFLIVAHYHGRIEHARRRYRHWIVLKRRQLARVRHDWEGIPVPAAAAAASSVGDHPFDLDLNITGERSLLHLIDTAVSQGGSDRLRGWLLERRADLNVVHARQRLVQEMVPLTLYRERLALNGLLTAGNVGERWHGEELMAWLTGRGREKGLRPWLLVLSAMAAINIGFGVAHLFGVAPWFWGASLVIYAAIYLFKRGDFSDLFDDALHLETSLGRFGAILLHCEHWSYSATPGLAEVARPFSEEGRRPSNHLRSIARVAAAASAQKNPVLRLLLNVVVPWDYYFAHRLNLVRGDVLELLPLWLDRWYEIEALGSLANFAELNPEFIVPIIVEDARFGDGGDQDRATQPGETLTGPIFEGIGLGHPLLRDTVRITNDFSVGRLGEVTIVTGSNMSGKSTFLRTLGINLVLAFAGGSVAARSMRTVPFRIFTCINVTDSVNDGISYFYAEVRRLKELLDALRHEDTLPLFFLIDEIFRGTNNRERLIGSRSYVRALAGGNGSGMISTHDLELVNLADEIPSLRNHHFRERVIGGRMEFDYTLRIGPSPTTNALEIMRMEGLPVDSGDSAGAATVIDTTIT